MFINIFIIIFQTKEKQYCPYEPQADSTVSHNCTDLSVVAEALGFILGGSNYASYINPFYRKKKTKNRYNYNYLKNI